MWPYYQVGVYNNYDGGWDPYGMRVRDTLILREAVERKVDAIVRADFQHKQEMNTMSVTAVETLDGMTVEQLRDLAKRAEAAAKQQEAAAKEKDYVKLGKIDGYEWRIRRSDGLCEACIRGQWSEFYKGLGAVIQKHRVPDLKIIQALVAAYTETLR